MGFTKLRLFWAVFFLVVSLPAGARAADTSAEEERILTEGLAGRSQEKLFDLSVFPPKKDKASAITRSPVEIEDPSGNEPSKFDDGWDTDLSDDERKTISAQRIENAPVYESATAKYSAALKVAGTTIGLTPERTDQAVKRLQRIAQWSWFRGVRAPDAFSVYLETSFGFGVGGMAGVEFLFLPRNDGKIAVGAFSYHGVTTGAEAKFSHSAGVDLIYNLEKLEGFEGGAVGFSMGIESILGGSLNLFIGTEPGDFAALRSYFFDSLLKRHFDFKNRMRQIYNSTRQFMFGAEFEAGAGASLNVCYGTWKLRGQTVADPLPDALRRQVLELKAAPLR